MFEEAIFGRSRSSRRGAYIYVSCIGNTQVEGLDYRSRRGAQRGPSFFDLPFMGGGGYYSAGGYSPSNYSSSSSGPRRLRAQQDDSQAKNRAAYEKRLKEFGAHRCLAHVFFV